MSTPELARRLDVDESTVRRWEAAGRITAVPHAGKRKRWDVADVLDQLGLPGADPSVLAAVTSPAGVLVAQVSGRAAVVVTGVVEHGDGVAVAAVDVPADAAIRWVGSWSALTEVIPESRIDGPVAAQLRRILPH